MALLFKDIPYTIKSFDKFLLTSSLKMYGVKSGEFVQLIITVCNVNLVFMGFITIFQDQLAFLQSTCPNIPQER